MIDILMKLAEAMESPVSLLLLVGNMVQGFALMGLIGYIARVHKRSAEWGREREELMGEIIKEQNRR